MHDHKIVCSETLMQTPSYIPMPTNLRILNEVHETDAVSRPSHILTYSAHTGVCREILIDTKI